MWAVAQIKPEPKSVERAIINLERQNYTVLHPTYSTRSVVRNKLRHVIRSLFVNYLFVFIDIEAGQRWVPAANSFGVSHLLTALGPDGYRQPKSVPDSYSEELMGLNLFPTPVGS